MMRSRKIVLVMAAAMVFALTVVRVQAEMIPVPNGVSSGDANLRLTITPNTLNPGSYDFKWDSQADKVYDLVSQTNLSTAPETWPVWDGREDIDDATPINRLTNVSGGGESARFFALISANWFDSIDLKINELMASNTSTRPDDHGEYDDWIEIYNPEDTAVDIGGMYLTDDLSEPTKWRIPDDAPAETTISPQGHLLLWADGDPEQGPRHVGFQLANTGEEVGLFAGDGQTLLSSITYGSQVTDISFGLYPDAADNSRFFDQPTPEAENVDGYLGRVASPEFSVRRGFYEEAFDVAVTCPTEGAAVYYTLGNTDPTEASTPYTGPVAISGTACLRVAAFKANYLPSAAVTHTYLFVADVIEHPELSTTITEDPVWGPQMRDALLEIPSISLVTQEDIPTEPIMSPPEVPVSIEMIFPDGRKGFQANAGIERFGGKYTVYPKHALRVSFKALYGPTRLKYNLFGDTPYGGDTAVDSFDQILLRNGSHDSVFSPHYSWSRGAYIRNRYFFDRQIELGHLSMRGAFVHVYLNGAYYGQYHLMERPNADFMATHLGGEEEDYDIMKGRSGIFVSQGERVAWDHLVANKANYAVVQDYMDVDNYIDYMLLNFYGGNKHDWYPQHNWIAGRKREPGGKFKFFMWDNDFLHRRGGNATTGSTADTTTHGGPGNMFGALKLHEEFKIRFADRAQKHFYNGGILTKERVKADFTELAGRISRTIIPEAARWSAEALEYIQTNDLDPRPSYNVFFTPDTFDTYIDWIVDINAETRSDVVIDQMRAQGIFPNIDAPAFSQHGGMVSSGFSLTMTASEGTMYYTLDGSDPRQTGGAPAGTAYSGPIPLTKSVIAKVRTLSGGVWSALNEATFGIGPLVDDLRITEINYHPTDPTQAEKDAAGDQTLIDEDFEYIEVKNIGGAPINLNLVHFTDGIDFTFGDTWLGAGQFAVVVKNQAAFAARYPGVAPSLMAGTYTGALDNDGEEIVLRDALGTEIHDFDFRDAWFVVTDGGGFSLNKLDPDTAGTTAPDSWDTQSGWRPSSVRGGTPGADDTGYTLQPEDIVISEVMTHTDDLVHGDWIGSWLLAEPLVTVCSRTKSSDPSLLKKIPSDVPFSAAPKFSCSVLYWPVTTPPDPEVR